MQRRKFIKTSLSAAAFAAIYSDVAGFAGTLDPRSFTRSEIEKGIRALFSEQRMGKGSRFGWNRHLINDLGLDSLDTVEVIIDAEAMFHCSITDTMAGNINTPKALVDLLYRGLNDAVICYTQPDSKGMAHYLFPESGAQSELIYNVPDYTKQIAHPLEGAIYKPKQYGLACRIDKETFLLSAPGKKWKTNTFIKTLVQLIKKEEAGLIGKRVALIVTNGT